MRELRCDIAVIGGGVIGGATALALARKRPNISIEILEREDHIASHQSGRNSGVIHSGFNLKPGSLKARFSVEGSVRLRRFCRERGLPVLETGTLVVATKDGDEAVLDELLRRGKENGVAGLERVRGARLRELEPNTRSDEGLFSPAGAITDGPSVSRAIIGAAEEAGVKTTVGAPVTRVERDADRWRMFTPKGAWNAGFVINCAGLRADEIAHLFGVANDHVIVPFRGEYQKVTGPKARLVRSMVYPAPDLDFPFLGVHWTRTASGDLIVGPSAALAFGKESYRFSSVQPVSMAEFMLTPNFARLVLSPAFRRLTVEQLGLSLSRRKFFESADRLVSGFELSDFKPAKAGNRAQLVARDGRLVDDMVVESGVDSIHVLNAVSPGFTCALPFGEMIAERV